MVIKIKDIEFKDLSGNEILIDRDELCKILGNFIYVKVPDLRWLEVAKSIHSTGCVELDYLEISGLIGLIKSDECRLIMAVKVSLIETLEQKDLLKD
jgi:hypothetical protein